MEREELDRLEHLLGELRAHRWAEPRRRKTFMQVSGIAGKETIASRILAFFLDPNERHGLGSLWLEALIGAAGKADQAFRPSNPSGYALSPVTCTVEAPTARIDRDLRLDILIEGNDFVLAIENKIGAEPYNNFESYAADIAALAGETADPEGSIPKTPLLVLLSMRDESAAIEQWAPTCSSHGVAFCNITYSQLFQRVNASLGQPYLRADAEWLLYMRDFMRTIEELEQPVSNLDTDLFEFLGNNLDDAELLRTKMELATKQLRAQGERLQELMLGDNELMSLGVGEPKIWMQRRAISLWCSTYYEAPALNVDGLIDPEITNTVRDVQVRVWCSNTAAKAELERFLDKQRVPYETNGSQSLVIERFPVSTDETALVEALKTFIKTILPILK